jgi:hypothetical protein
MRTTHLALLIIALLAAGCRHVPSSNSTSHRILASDADIRANVVGTWKSEQPQWGGEAALAFRSDGSFEWTRKGSPPRQGTWQQYHGWLVLKDNDSTISPGVLQLAVWHIDAHEFLFDVGLSTAGPPDRFTR